MQPELINLTPHTLNIRLKNGEWTTVERSGTIARIETVADHTVEYITGINCRRTAYKNVIGLPDSEPTKIYIYIVSNFVEMVTDRPDVYAPGELIRDEHGHVLGCDGLKFTSPKNVKSLIERNFHI